MMDRLESPSLVRRYFKCQNVLDTPSEKTTEATIFMTDSLKLDLCMIGNDQEDHSQQLQKKLDEIEEVLSNNPRISIHCVSQEVSMPKTTMYLAMCDVLGYKLYRSHLIQQLDDEDKDVRDVVAEILLPILDAPHNDRWIFFSDKATLHLSRMIHEHVCRI